MTMHLLILLAALSLLAGCDAVAPGPSDVTLDEGYRLESTTYGSPLPSSREGYAEMGTFIRSGGHVVLFDPGTGPDDPPALVRSFRIPDHYTRDAQMDRDGFLWVATPDRPAQGTLQVAYVIDPHTGTVHRTIRLPRELRAAAAVVVGPERVYFRAWRDGFSGGVGAVDRGCATDASRCEVELFTELDDVGTTPENAFRLTDDALYSFSGLNSRDRRRSTDKIDPQTGEILASSPYSGTFAWNDTSLFVIGAQTGFTAGTYYLLRLDANTLDLIDQEQIGLNTGQIALEDGLLYLTKYTYPNAQQSPAVIEVRSAETLDLVDTIDVSASRGATAAFGFVAPGVLMINHTSYLDVRSESVTANAFPAESIFSYALRLPEGHSFAH
jgi:hypothetical protein